MVLAAPAFEVFRQFGSVLSGGGEEPNPYRDRLDGMLNSPPPRAPAPAPTSARAPVQAPEPNVYRDKLDGMLNSPPVPAQPKTRAEAREEFDARRSQVQSERAARVAAREQAYQERRTELDANKAARKKASHLLTKDGQAEAARDALQATRADVLREDGFGVAGGVKLRQPSWDEWMQLTDQQQTAATINTMLSEAIERDSKLGERFELKPEQQAAYDERLAELGGGEGLEQVQPNLVAALSEIGWTPGSSALRVSDFADGAGYLSVEEVDRITQAGVGGRTGVTLGGFGENMGTELNRQLLLSGEQMMERYRTDANENSELRSVIAARLEGHLRPLVGDQYAVIQEESIPGFAAQPEPGSLDDALQTTFRKMVYTRDPDRRDALLTDLYGQLAANGLGPEVFSQYAVRMLSDRRRYDEAFEVRDDVERMQATELADALGFGGEV